MSHTSDHGAAMEDDAEFQEAALYAKENFKRMTSDQVILFFGLYKQATVGPNKSPKPQQSDLLSQEKWEAWNNHGTKARKAAMNEYVVALTEFDPNWRDKVAPISDDDNIDEDNELSQVFNRAAEFAKGLIDKMSAEQVLRLYGAYKQATEGRNTKPKPSFYQVKEKQKWEAWSAFGSKTKEEAMNEYIWLVTKVDPTWQEQSTPNTAWVRHSTLLNDEAAVPEAEKDLFYFVKENDVAGLQNALAAGEVNQTDEDGLTLLHWAADRGNASAVRALLAAGCAVDVQDGEGQTALHYAASCGHRDVVVALLTAGATLNLADADGNKPCDVAANQGIAEIIANSV